MTSIQMIHLATRHFGATLPPRWRHDRGSRLGQPLGGQCRLFFFFFFWLHTCRGHLCSRCLSAAPLLDRRFLEPELAALNQPVTAPDPVVEGYARFDPATTGPIKVGNITLGFDPATGALTQLVDDGGGGGRKSWATPANPLLGVNYQTYNISQFEAFQRAYGALQDPLGPFYYYYLFITRGFQRHPARAVQYGPLVLASLGPDAPRTRC